MYLKLSQHKEPVKGFRLGGQVSREEYLTMAGQIEEAIEQVGAPLCLLIEVREINEDDATAMWEDLKFTVKHWGEIGHLALVGNPAVLASWNTFGSSLVQTQIKTFAPDQIENAWNWLREAHNEVHGHAASRARQADAPRNYQRILAAIDLAPSSAYVASCAQRMADQFNAELVLMHVVDFEPTIAMGYGWEVAANIDHDPAEFEDPAAERLQAFAKDLGLHSANRVVSTGDPKFRVLEACEEHDIDLIVMGSRARHGLGRLLGSTANGVVQRADCDVLTVRIPRD